MRRSARDHAGKELPLADADGLDAVTLRRVASAWNVTPMALYWHFNDKDALLDMMAERVIGLLRAGGGTRRGPRPS